MMTDSFRYGWTQGSNSCFGALLWRSIEVWMVFVCQFDCGEINILFSRESCSFQRTDACTHIHTHTRARARARARIHTQTLLFWRRFYCQCKDWCVQNRWVFLKRMAPLSMGWTNKKEKNGQELHLKTRKQWHGEFQNAVILLHEMHASTDP